MLFKLKAIKLFSLNNFILIHFLKKKTTYFIFRQNYAGAIVYKCH